MRNSDPGLSVVFTQRPDSNFNSVFTIQATGRDFQYGSNFCASETDTETHTETETQRHRDRDRQSHRDTETQTDTDTHRQTQTHTDTHRHTHRHKHRQTETHTQTDSGTHTDRQWHTHRQTVAHTHRQTETHTQTDRDTHTQTETHTQRQRPTHRDRDRGTHTETETETHTETETETNTQRQRQRHRHRHTQRLESKRPRVNEDKRNNRLGKCSHAISEVWEKSHSEDLGRQEHGRGRHLCISSSIHLQKRPDVVKVLKDNSLRPKKQSQSQRSVKVSTVSPEHGAKRDVTASDEQGPRERSFIVREFRDEWSSWHH